MFPGNKRLNYLYWIITGILSILFIYLLVKSFPYYSIFFSFLWKLSIPFLIAILIAYLLYPIINKIHSYNIHKGLAILFIYVLFFGGIAYLIYRVYPVIVLQVRDLANNFPKMTDMYEGIVLNIYEYTSFLPETVHDKMDQLIIGLEKSIENVLTKLVGGFTRIFDMILVITIIPVLVFYFLKDYDRMKDFFKQFIPTRYREPLSKMVHAIDANLGSYIRGQLLICLIITIITLIVFKLLHIEYALLLAVILGITNIIPYFGPIIGSIPAVAIAATTSGSLVIFVLVAVFAIQTIEGNLLSPYIVGKSIAIHPVAIILAILVGSKLFGVIGLILAVPILTILKVIVKHIWDFRAEH
ncbi:AI-2E family transporter [Oceanobacillus chungangensis]|uniref:AI-2E family transporter n=1 Tax=Oceanobacillus chungangensis TaxID=1229152 RepID=A0A3D8Q0B6_9BACI|nr:AI-2E family transporter [Oceanobacillus chungangensis]RDW21704.1 AI-2E family transporter [Oceanobacillus chungangensis]